MVVICSPGCSKGPAILMTKHGPCPEGYMYRLHKKNTICQILREIYWLTDDDQVRLKVRTAVTMAKAMDKKLRENNERWDKAEFWDDNNNRVYCKDFMAVAKP